MLPPTLLVLSLYVCSTAKQALGMTIPQQQEQTFRSLPFQARQSRYPKSFLTRDESEKVNTIVNVTNDADMQVNAIFILVAISPLTLSS